MANYHHRYHTCLVILRSTEVGIMLSVNLPHILGVVYIHRKCKNAYLFC